MDQDQQSRLKELIAKGKEQGFLTYTEVNDHLPDGIVEPEQIEDIIRMINDMGIKVHESAPTESNEILSDTETEPDEDAAEEDTADDDAAEERGDSCCAVHIGCFHPTGEFSPAVCELQPVLRRCRTYVRRYSEGRT